MDEVVLLKVSEVLSRHDYVDAVYLFGSQASGQAQAKNDIDLGVAVKRGKQRDEVRLSLLTELAREGYDSVDLVVMDGSDLVLDYEVVSHQKILFSRPEFDSSEFYSLTVRRYLDFLPSLKIYRDALKARLSKGFNTED